ncbi:prolipoprotein diacylglyceryl transferase [Halalkalibacterium halodurans]|uniref:Phosphatidylglycerol--prolipoprotein diacylglyceryl transferase n=1 Tax=Halalkalibacterium halodurans (strain ATCC BAA-125 / DSM 18197 / FERM 7344 / JCM 9153 / C-125) TaxID=272558 RepID=LGT_HALH5|nr:prolipoprotein diacylglyceryl transferase [Halalkalibacterium halodurans]Q9K6Y5.1 RecName: Full=Phosphatidylglycerol--prolipoprotein diacylglyceryl transferase [Halalkalibacterium halodurans C-125]MED4126288.1 prolipoprotein diacylglyceryl transferase [Halalkalibacterium halodurans]MED4172919.1 prolipoprotein diacylglyceryl transferase [Halalkalibacterium halodurans]BAB07308.1 prolipoprotein diacylglyceryl transferase [Halalkalibacterium halodurans C-125]
MEEMIEPLDRVFLQLGPFTIYWYGVLIGLGVIIGYVMASRESVRRGMPKDTFSDFVMYVIPVAIIFARLYYVIFRWEQYADDPIRVFYIWEGGLAIHGALIGGVLTAYILTKKRQLSFWQLMDVAAPSILIGQAIGRWGNFMNQEVYGGPVTREFLEGLMLPEFIINQMYINGTYYHPTFLYESIWNFIGVVVLLLLRRVNLRRGELFFSYLIWYSIGRFFIEGMRLDNLMIGDSLRTAQIVSILLIVGALLLWWYRRAKGLATERYLDPHQPARTNGNKKKTKKKKKK